MSPHVDGFTGTLALVAGWLSVGLAIGAMHFATLRWNMAKFAAARSLAVPLLLQAMRLLLMAALLVAVVRLGGAPALLLVAAGIMVARAVAVRRERPA